MKPKGHRKMNCMDQQVTAVEEMKLEIKVEPRDSKQEIYGDIFDGGVEEFIQDTSGKSLGKFSEERKPKDGPQEIESVVALDSFERFDEGMKEFIQEDNTKKAEYLDELKSEILANTSDEEFMSEPKKSAPLKVKAENRKSESFLKPTSGIKNEKSITDQKIASIPNKKNTSYTCNVCGKIFKIQYSLNLHMNIHKDIKPHDCKICGRTFAQKPHLARHMRTHNGERPYKCSYCPAAFADVSSQRVHHRTHTNERPYVCDICGKSFPTNYLNKHRRDVHNMIGTTSVKPHENIKPKPYECEICEHSFAQKPHLKRHMRTHTGERPYKCSYCPATFPDASTVKMHHRTHTNERPYVCGICGKSFATNVLKRHEKEVHNMSDTSVKPHVNIKPKPYECEICERAFAQKPHLTRHMRTHTGERPYKCTYCPATFPDSSSVKKHHRTHTNERPYTCDICDKSFTTNVLKRHKRVAHNIIDFGEKPHEKIKPKFYDCEICERHFTQKANLMRHIKSAHPADFEKLSSNHKHGIHTDEKTNEKFKKSKLHECETCGRKFPKSEYLKRHKRIHTGERPYKCSYCSAAFSDASTRTRHHRMHKNLRPYVCDVCGKSFTYSNTLKLHKMIHTGEKPYVCDVCGKGFIRDVKLRNHKLTHFKNKVSDTKEMILVHQFEIDDDAAKNEIDKILTTEN